MGGLTAVVISHPHYYATHLHWARAFGCPVYLSAEDAEWAVRRDLESASGDGAGAGEQVFWEGKELLPLKMARSGSGSRSAMEADDLVVIKTGGHFPGSSVLWWKSLKKLLIADSILVVPSGIYHVDRPAGTASFTFMWSYPNMVCSCLLAVRRGLANGFLRFRFLRMRCTIFGRRLRIRSLMMRMLRLWAWILGGTVRSGCWRVRRSL